MRVSRQSRRRFGLTLAGLVAAVVVSLVNGTGSHTGTHPGSQTGSPGPSSSPSGSGGSGSSAPATAATVSPADLPAEARRTMTLIERGGPYPYPEHDGGVFGNYEGVLPDRQRGYYHEFTVPTPGETDRGPRRIVTGEAGDWYYTGDHYRTFARIAGH